MGTISSTSYFFPLLHWVRREEGKERGCGAGAWVWGTTARLGPAVASSSRAVMAEVAAHVDH